jgi:DNA-binding transcriptional LysR family regulator
LAADHPLAGNTEIALDDFLQEPLIEVPVRDQLWSDFWTAAAERGGKPPRVGAKVETLDGLIEAIGAGLGVATSIAPVVDALGPAAGVVFRPVPGLTPLDFWVARQLGDDRHQVAAFFDAAIAALAPVAEPSG